MNEISTVISVETKHDALSSGERGVKMSDCASLSESSHLTRSTNLRNEKKFGRTEWRWANAENGYKNTWRSYSWGAKPLTLEINNHKQRKFACL
jgi:hypothetical protein